VLRVPVEASLGINSFVSTYYPHVFSLGREQIMHTLYVSQQGCSISLQQEQLIVRRGEEIQQRVQLPLIEQVLVFGQSQ
jgi:hypothetical protein